MPLGVSVRRRPTHTASMLNASPADMKALSWMFLAGSAAASALFSLDSLRGIQCPGGGCPRVAQMLLEKHSVLNTLLNRALSNSWHKRSHWFRLRSPAPFLEDCQLSSVPSSPLSLRGG
ncbi:uncharacterized protein LOC107138133 isoform X2 [Marmota marmota marmota]|uniref:uncharacterized protein LOC107138133 isoform X2 n=1 Tax=Marmota marmota marmota TaxID=9994 RepID=UPI002092ACF6|nr:uncharacterized protein LOC107138133 isoform X2 [Marmota marmota marmota]